MSNAPLRELLLKRRSLEEAIAQDDYVKFKFKAQLRELEKIDGAVDRLLNQAEPAANAEAIAHLEAAIALLKGTEAPTPPKSPRKREAKPSPGAPAVAKEAGARA